MTATDPTPPTPPAPPTPSGPTKDDVQSWVREVLDERDPTPTPTGDDDKPITIRDVEAAAGRAMKKAMKELIDNPPTPPTPPTPPPGPTPPEPPEPAPTVSNRLRKFLVGE